MSICVQIIVNKVSIKSTEHDEESQPLKVPEEPVETQGNS